MNSFSQTNKNLFTYLLIFLLFLPIIGFKLMMALIGNILLLLFLVPILLLLIGFISFNTLKSKVYSCETCGSISLGLNDTCTNCGADLEKKDMIKKPGERTIEVKAEEIK